MPLYAYVLIAIVMLGCNRAQSTAPPVTAGPRYLALGDSYTIGESVDESDRYPVQLARMLREQQIDFIDNTPISKKAAEDRTLVADDGLHPSGKMYALWAREALPAARTALGK